MFKISSSGVIILPSRRYRNHHKTKTGLKTKLMFSNDSAIPFHSTLRWLALCPLPHLTWHESWLIATWYWQRSVECAMHLYKWKQVEDFGKLSSTVINSSQHVGSWWCLPPIPIVPCLSMMPPRNDGTVMSSTIIRRAPADKHLSSLSWPQLAEWTN